MYGCVKIITTVLNSCLTHVGFLFIFSIGYFNLSFFAPEVINEQNRKRYTPLLSDFEKIYCYYVYRRIRDCANRPICSVPGNSVTFLDRKTNDNGWTFEFTGTTTNFINLGSYNYLGFAQNEGTCINDVVKCIETNGIATCSPRRDLGSL
jgi:serine palmitoyltransferase